MNRTKIDWADATWNPVTGCSKYTAGCKNCYAYAMACRLQAIGNEKYKNGFNVTLHPKDLSEPRYEAEPLLIFVCSMADLFHDKVPFEFIDKVMDVIRSTPWHTYQILTKRAERMAEYFESRAVPNNVWLGVTVENQKVRYRIDILRNLNAPIRFLSCEPLLEDLGELNFDNIDWVIVGGEDANEYIARPMKKEWVLSIKEQAEEQSTMFYSKQWGVYGEDGVRRDKETNGNKLDGKIYHEMPRINHYTLFG